jgi:hypothetical protein
LSVLNMIGVTAVAAAGGAAFAAGEVMAGIISLTFSVIFGVGFLANAEKEAVKNAERG